MCKSAFFIEKKNGTRVFRYADGMNVRSRMFILNKILVFSILKRWRHLMVIERWRHPLTEDNEWCHLRTQITFVFFFWMINSSEYWEKYCWQSTEVICITYQPPHSNRWLTPLLRLCFVASVLYFTYISSNCLNNEVVRLIR